ncbi:ImmA/IrrE family metallo-endopeptidase [uncultured Amnibacterium sp.]|uniref:ImmA/IrrE family metallo-endopeptidase n=1 Tax=uncultured Amnibacterium sp. TaxID=1631851 RepID=UPI0035C97B18
MIEVKEARFRASSRATLRQRDAACAVGASGIEFYSWLATRFRLRDVILPDLDGEKPERAAEAVRALWGQGRGALPNLLQLSEAHGLRVMSLPMIAHTVDAFSLWRDAEPYVFLSTMKTAERSRFDLAHEIGHLVMHSRGHEGDLEAEADAFAASFLMPADLLLARVGREPALPAVLRLRSHYGVAALTMLRRLHDLGRLSDNAYRMDCVALAQRGCRSGEVGGLPREPSQVFRQTFEALRSNNVTAEQAAREVGLWASDLHDLTFGHFVAPVESRGDAARTPVRAALRAV